MQLYVLIYLPMRPYAGVRLYITPGYGSRTLPRDTANTGIQLHNQHNWLIMNPNNLDCSIYWWRHNVSVGPTVPESKLMLSASNIHIRCAAWEHVEANFLGAIHSWRCQWANLGWDHHQSTSKMLVWIPWQVTTSMVGEGAETIPSGEPANTPCNWWWSVHQVLGKCESMPAYKCTQ